MSGLVSTHASGATASWLSSASAAAVKQPLASDDATWRSSGAPGQTAPLAASFASSTVTRRTTPSTEAPWRKRVSDSSASRSRSAAARARSAAAHPPAISTQGGVPSRTTSCARVATTIFFGAASGPKTVRR